MTNDKEVENDLPAQDGGPLTEQITEQATEQEQLENQTEAAAASSVHTTEQPSEKIKLKAKPPKRKRRVGLWFSLGMMVMVAGALVYGGYWLHNQVALFTEQQSSIVADLEQQLQGQGQAIATLTRNQQQQVLELQNTLSETTSRVNAAEQRLAAQNKRILSMSTTSREDWLLAEAEYLLKLANQRVLIERSAEGADALLTEADGILRDLNDPDLFPLRQAIANDLAKLRLTSKIDVEGIYLALGGLAAQVENLPARPTREQLLGGDLFEPDGEISPSENLNSGPEVNGWWNKIKNSFSSFIGSSTAFFHYEDHSVKPPPLLQPETTQYLQQNLRLILERGQLALMREQQQIYMDSLSQAQEWIQKYYPSSEQKYAFVNQVAALKQKNIVQQLPDISESLELLHSYLEQLHNLDGVESSQNEKDQ